MLGTRVMVSLGTRVMVSLGMRVMVSLGKRVIVTLDTRVKVSQAVLSQWNPPQTTISTVKSRKKRKVLPT